MANYAGVTVDQREGRFVDDPNVVVIDLPGTYSLRATSPDEKVARDVVLGKLGQQPDAIVSVADATNLRMTLRMVLEVKTLGLPMVVSLNLSDVARHRGLKIDAAKLSELLGVPVLETAAINSASMREVREAVARLPRKGEKPAHALTAEEAEKRLDALDSNALYAQVEDILRQVVRHELTLPAWHRQLDAIVMHPVWGMLILMLILMLVFQAVYAWAEPVIPVIET